MGVDKKARNTNRFTKGIYTLSLFFGMLTLAVFFYPTVSDAWNRYVVSLRISDYRYQQGNLPDSEELMKEAEQYNQELYLHGRNHISEYTARLSGDRQDMGKIINPDSYYEAQLNRLSNQMMGYIEIGKLNITLPIYHYASEEVLEKGVGHLYGSSLPVGGTNTHTVLTGHSGLVEAKLFSDLDELEKGDKFMIHVLDQVLCYEIDQINIVNPEDMELLAIEDGNDLATLITCTPYGINTHRLLVRGRRISDLEAIKIEEKTRIAQMKEFVEFPITIFIMIGIVLLGGVMTLIFIWRN